MTYYFAPITIVTVTVTVLTVYSVLYSVQLVTYKIASFDTDINASNIGHDLPKLNTPHQYLYYDGKK